MPLSSGVSRNAYNVHVDRFGRGSYPSIAGRYTLAFDYFMVHLRTYLYAHHAQAD